MSPKTQHRPRGRMIPRPPPAVPPSAQGTVGMSTSSIPPSPAARQQESLDPRRNTDESITPYYDDVDELLQQEYVEPPPRKRQRRHYRSFHFISAHFVSSCKRGASHRLQARLTKRNVIPRDHPKTVAERRGLA